MGYMTGLEVGDLHLGMRSYKGPFQIWTYDHGSYRKRETSRATRERKRSIATGIDAWKFSDGMDGRSKPSVFSRMIESFVRQGGSVGWLVVQEFQIVEYSVEPCTEIQYIPLGEDDGGDVSSERAERILAIVESMFFRQAVPPRTLPPVR